MLGTCITVTIIKDARFILRNGDKDATWRVRPFRLQSTTNAVSLGLLFHFSASSYFVTVADYDFKVRVGPRGWSRSLFVQHDISTIRTFY